MLIGFIIIIMWLLIGVLGVWLSIRKENPEVITVSDVVLMLVLILIGPCSLVVYCLLSDKVLINLRKGE